MLTEMHISTSFTTYIGLLQVWAGPANINLWWMLEQVLKGHTHFWYLRITWMKIVQARNDDDDDEMHFLSLDQQQQTTEAI